MPTIPEAMAMAVRDHQAGDLDAAARIYRQVLAAEPKEADAWHLLGVVHLQRGEHAVAADLIGRAIGLNSSAADFHGSLGMAHQALAQHDEAIACFRRVLELQPDSAEAHYNLGNILKDHYQPNEAIACYCKAVELKPDFAPAHNNLALVLRGQNLLDEAAACCRRTLELQPDFVEAHNNLALVLTEQGQLDDAAECCRRALNLQPELAEAHANLGSILARQKRDIQAVASFRRALQLKPDFVDAHGNLGSLLARRGDFDEAATCFRRAIELKPDHAETHMNFGIALLAQGEIDQAAAQQRRALELEPDFPQAHFNLGMILLLLGRYAEGWAECEWRWKRRGREEPVAGQPRWAGSSLDGRTILLRSEQGLGDTLQFVRYAELLSSQGAKVIVEVPRPLIPLLEQAGIRGLVARGAPLPPFDFHLPLLSLPGVLGTTAETIPARIPYLSADPRLVEHWRGVLDKTDEFQVGIAWQGDPTYQDDHLRSIPLDHFAPLRDARVELISLQKGLGSEQLAAVAGKFPVRDLGDHVDTEHGAFMDTAAIMKNLDLVVTSDSAVAHLAGALGVPVWVALPWIPDWRWLLERRDSPWYPTMRLFRQTARGDWSGVFQGINRELNEMM